MERICLCVKEPYAISCKAMSTDTALKKGKQE